MDTYTYNSKNGGIVIKSRDGLFTSSIIKEEGWVYLLNQMNANADLIPLKFISDLLPTMTLEEHQSMFDGLCSTHRNIELGIDKAFIPRPFNLSDFNKQKKKQNLLSPSPLSALSSIERGYHAN